MQGGAVRGGQIQVSARRIKSEEMVRLDHVTKRYGVRIGFERFGQLHYKFSMDCSTITCEDVVSGKRLKGSIFAAYISSYYSHINAMTYFTRPDVGASTWMSLDINTRDNAMDNLTDVLDDSHDHNEPEEAQSEGNPHSSTPTPLDFKANLERFRHAPIVEVPARPALATDSSPASTSRRKRRLDEVVEDGTTAAKSPSPGKKPRQSSRYAPPSKYAHLPKLVDILEPCLIGVFVGFNPGVRTATAGHAYAHPSNMFWKLLHSSGITDVRLRPEQDVDLPQLYSMGNTNLVDRPSKDAGELSKQEMAAGAPILEEKVRAFRPEAVCIVGKSIWQAIWRWKHKREIKKDEFRYGWQDAKERMGKEGEWPGAWVFVATATSGLAASLKPHEKEAIWKPFGEWVQKRRQERQEEANAGE